MSTTQTRSLEHRHYSPSAAVVVHDKSGLYVAVFAAVLSAICLGLLLAMPALVEAQVKAGVARAEAKSESANTNARVALDKVEDVRTKLAEKGINIRLDGH